MKIIKAIFKRKEYFVLVAKEDYPTLVDFHWRLDDWGYAFRRITLSGKRIKILMHREIMNTPGGKETDHINGDKTDNRRTNLRICTRQQNAKNKGSPKNSPSPHPGVHFNKLERKYKATIGLDYKIIFLGTFEKKEDAVAARIIAEEKYYGEFARQS